MAKVSKKAARPDHTGSEPSGVVRIELEQVSLKTEDAAASSFDLARFNEKCSVKIVRSGKDVLEFDVVGVDASVANALRRSMLSEVPTMAIETVFVVSNTSIIPDEVLSHRLGLIPIYADPRKFDYLVGGQPTDVNTILFELREKCSSDGGSDPSSRYLNSHVYSQSLKWVPQGSQAEVFSADPIRPLFGDILIAKLRPGQEIDLEVHCIKGTGKDHAKWSPVSVASYRLLPQIKILEPIQGEDAVKLAKCFVKGVVEVEPDSRGVPTAVVRNPRIDTVSRECLRHPEFAGRIELSRVADHFIFQVESTSFFSPDTVVVEALKLLSDKCARLRSSLEK